MTRHSPSHASITSGSSSATPGSRRTSTATPSASTWSPTPAWRRESRHEAGYVLRQGDITFVLASPLSAEHPDSQRLVTHGDGVQDIALEVTTCAAAYRGGRRAAGPTASTPPHVARGRVRRLRVRHHPRLRRHDAHASSTATATAASSRRASSRSTRTATARARSTPSASRRSTTSSATSRKGR